MTESSFPSEHEVVFLQNDTVKLCVPHKAHVPYLLRWFNNPEVVEHLGFFTPQFESAELVWLEKLAKDKFNFVFVLHTPEGEPIGTMGLHQINYVDGTASTGAAIGEKEYWGKGYGTAAKKLLLEWAFNRINLRAIRSSVIDFNERSHAYLKKTGYREIGRLPNWIYRGGTYHAEIIMVVTREDFEKVMSAQKVEF